MSKTSVDSVMQKFQPIKVPTGNLERIFLYFKKYPKEFNQSQCETSDSTPASLYSTLNKHSFKNPPSGATTSFSRPTPKMTLASQAPPPKTAAEKSKITVKSFENPMLKTLQNPSENFAKTTSKIFEDLPEDRTMLVINFDKQYDDGFMRKVFSTNGKIRRIESGRIKQKSTGSKKNLFFCVIVYKHERDMIRAFDLELFQHKMLEKFNAAYRQMTQHEKDQTLDNYLTSIEGNIDFSGGLGMTSDGFMIVQEKPGVSKRERSMEEFDGKRRRKRKPKEKEDFYKFQLKNVNDQRVVHMEGEIGHNEMMEDEYGRIQESDGEEAWEDLDIGKLADKSYLEKRKELLKERFQKELKARKLLKTE